jgi:hypothetical protein
MSQKDDKTVTLGPVAGEDFRSGEFRTQFATEAVNLSEIFRLLIGSTPVRGPVTFHVEMSAPEGPSTGGGVQSVQHLKLLPNDGGTTLVCGWADQKAETCELRTLDCLDAQHHERFKKSQLAAPPAPSARLDRLHYGQLVERLRSFFAERDFRVTIIDAAEVSHKTLLQGKIKPQRRGIAVLLGLLIGTAIAAIAYFVALR